MTVPTLTVSPAGAARAYSRVQSGAEASTGFGDVLQKALGAVVQTGQAAEAQSMQAIAGGGNLTDVVTAVSQAEMALQSAVAIRDRVVSAYQDVMRMPI